MNTAAIVIPIVVVVVLLVLLGLYLLTAYRSLVQSIRGHYPEAHIVCVLGSGVSDSHPKDIQARTRVRELLLRLVESSRAAGDTRVHFAEVPANREDEGLGCLWHPSRKTHQRTAAQMTPLLREWLGWDAPGQR